MKSFFLMASICYACNCGFALERITALNRDSFLLIKKALQEKFGQNKEFEPSLELECLAALSFYPELASTHIRFRYGQPAATMVSRPGLSTFLFPGKARSYVIIIRRPGQSHNGLDWTELSFNALVGWIGHELSHLVYYEQKTDAGMIAFGIRYAIPAWRKKIERFTDFVTIEHSLAMALHEGTEYTINRSMAKSRYKKYLSNFYLQPDEILRLDSTRQRYALNFHHTRFRPNVTERDKP